MDCSGLKALAERWHEEADLLRRRGALHHADALESCAEDLETELRDWVLEPLTVAEAAAESGYSHRRLRELLAEGTLPNAGQKGAPRIRRGDLPAKPGKGEPALDIAEGNKSLADEALARRAGR